MRRKGLNVKRNVVRNATLPAKKNAAKLIPVRNVKTRRPARRKQPEPDTLYLILAVKYLIVIAFTLKAIIFFHLIILFVISIILEIKQPGLKNVMREIVAVQILIGQGIEYFYNSLIVTIQLQPTKITVHENNYQGPVVHHDVVPICGVGSLVWPTFEISLRNWL
jgi:hypothetical protein